MTELSDNELIQISNLWSLAETARAPRYSDAVHNDECLFTFTTPFAPEGLFVNLKTWVGVSRDFVRDDVTANGGMAAYVWLRNRRVPKPESSIVQPTKLAIGMEGGFTDEKFTVEKSVSIVMVAPPAFDFREFSLTDETVPEPLVVAAKTVAEHRGAAEQQQVKAWEAMEDLSESRFARDLFQLPVSDEKKQLLQDPSRWRCEVSGATQNLWLNLSDGFIGGGRKNFDGSGGSNGAIDHFHAKKREGFLYPLAVKLGTITPEGTADVYSYEEDCMVIDPLLPQHLLHFGIDAKSSKKSDRTLAELELELNKDFAFDKIVESEETLEPVTDRMGLVNLGNTCYMNSVVQLLNAVPDFRDRYSDASCVIRRQIGQPFLTSSADANRTLFELFKLCSGLNALAPEALTPHAFRTQITKSNAEFRSNRQQDAVEFLLYTLKELTKAERASMTENLSENLFKFELEDRLTCDGAVRYSTRSELILSVHVTKDDLSVTSKRERSSDSPMTTEASVEFIKCLERVFAPTALSNYRSPITGEVSENTAKSVGLASMPKYLLVTVNRYYFTEKYEAAKLDCAVLMPESLSLERFRSQGVQPGETLLPDGPASKFAANPEILAQLTAMGFPESVALQACEATKNANAEVALQWCLENPDGFGAPATAVSSTKGGSYDVGLVQTLTAMGFTETQASAALEATNGDAERAVDWLFSRADQLDQIAPATTTTAKPTKLEDGNGNYELVGIVSHLGKSTAVGHYVAHIKDNNGWVIFNDQHVAKSKQPPLNYGYLYLYRRVD